MALDDGRRSDEVNVTLTEKTRCRRVCRTVQNNVLLVATVCCVITGVVIGLTCRQFDPSPNTIQFVGFPGEVFMRMFKMLLLPLIVSSMVAGLANVKGKSGGKLGLFTLIYYTSTTLVAISIGIILALTIKPGEGTPGASSSLATRTQPLPTAVDTFLDLVRNLVPENILQAGVKHCKTVYTEIVPQSIDRNASPDNSSMNSSMTPKYKMTEHWRKSVTYHDGLNVLGLLFFSAVFGVLVNKSGGRAHVMVEFFNILNEIMLTMTRAAMWYCPIGILSIIVSKILEVPDIGQAAHTLGMYIVTGLAGLAIHALLVLPGIYFLLTRQNPYRVSLRMLQALLVAMGTSSSSATLPVTFQCCVNKLKFDSNICGFILPIGATINMDGLAIIQAMTPLFIAQINNKTLMFGDILVISLSATLVSIGAAGVPGTGFITMLAVVAAAGLPVEDAYIVLAVDWFMMRMVTMVNIYGDALAAGIMTHFFTRSRDNLRI